MTAMDGKRSLVFNTWHDHSVPLAPQFPIRVVDCLKQTHETGGLVDWPYAPEALAQQAEFILRQKPDGHDAALVQHESPKT